MGDYYAGDIIRVSVAKSSVQGPNLLDAGELGWAVANHNSFRDGNWEMCHLEITWVEPKRLGLECPFLDKSDTFTLADSAEIPDDVLAAVTAAKLGGTPIADNREDD